jgi:DNA-directed RNA polymerase specialized sigma24 family protein
MSVHVAIQIRDRHESASHALWHACFPRIVRMSRRMLGHMPRNIVDEQDIAALVLAEFMLEVCAGRHMHITDEDDLWRLLATKTACRVIDQRRYLARRCRFTEMDRSPVFQLLDDRPGAESMAASSERFDRLLACLDDPELRQIALEKYAGHTNDEIAASNGYSLRTVERRLQTIRAKMSLKSEAVLGRK